MAGSLELDELLGPVEFSAPPLLNWQNLPCQLTRLATCRLGKKQGRDGAERGCAPSPAR